MAEVYVGRFIIGIGVGMSGIIGTLYIAETTPYLYRGQFMQIQFVSLALGRIIAIIICIVF